LSLITNKPGSGSSYRWLHWASKSGRGLEAEERGGSILLLKKLEPGNSSSSGEITVQSGSRKRTKMFQENSLAFFQKKEVTNTA